MITIKKINSLLGLIKSANAELVDETITQEMIDKITVNDIKAAASYIFNSNPTISLVATKNTINNNIGYLKQQGKIVEA